MRSRDHDAVQAYLQELLSEVPPDSVPPVAHSAGPRAAPAAAVPPTQLAEQQVVLETIKRRQLQEMLDRTAAAPKVETAPVVEVTGEAPDAQVAAAQVAAAPVAAAPLTTEQPAAAQTAVPDPAVTTPVAPLLEWAENGRPVWAQRKFDVLLFRVAGLTLAVPLVALGQIYPVTDALTPIFGQADWFMGLQPTPAGQIRTVNTALFVMPERYDPEFAKTARYVISIDGLDWGLAVDSVQQPTRLQPEDVTWRTQRGKRPWLAGTVKAAMCALLDIPQMGQLLQSHDRKRQPRA